MDSTKWKSVGKAQVIRIATKEFARGSQSTIHRGRYDDKDVAVKRLLLSGKKLDNKELENLRNVKHDNVIEYKFSDHDDEFLYIVLEICEFSLEDYVHQKVKISLSKVVVLKQIIDGLNYLHNENEFCNVHRDLKPSNILFVRSGNSWRAKISDFGISKYIPSDQTSLTRTSSVGSKGYMAPEELKEGEKRIRKESDIFSLGIVSYYLLSNGKHPYGEDHLKWDSKIRDDEPPELTSIEPIYFMDATSLITSMLVHDFGKRIKIEQIKAHHLFWDAERKVTFFQEVSDYLEDRQTHQKLINRLDKEGKGAEIAVDWRENLESETESEIVRTTVGKLGKNRKNLQDLIRLVRNWNHHYHDAKTPEELRKEIGGVPGGLVTFFTSRYPKLLPFVYDLMKSENVPHLEKFYSAKAKKVSAALTTSGVSSGDSCGPSFPSEMEVDEDFGELLGIEENDEEMDSQSVSPFVLRNYQSELAEQALAGHNSLIIAPTGSGKTAVAKEIIAHHLDSGKSKSILFLVSKTTLARQQYDFFSRHLEDRVGEKVAYLIGENAVRTPVGGTIKTNKLTVLTPQILVDELNRSHPYISFKDISMLVFDECHNATKKHPYKVIMDKLLDYSAADLNPIQIVGMTASPGVGKGKHREQVLQNLIELLANLNIKMYPTVVVKHVEELKKHQNEIEESFIRVNIETDIFCKKVLKAMDLIEKRIKDEGIIGKDAKKLREPPEYKNKQMYENWTIDVINHAKVNVDDREVSRIVITYAEHLKMYHQLLYLNKHIPNAMELTKNMVNFDQAGKPGSFLRKIYSELQKAAEKVVDLPAMLKKLLEILKKEFTKNSKSSCIIFVPRKKIAVSLVECISNDEDLKELNPKPLTTAHEHQASGGMTKTDQIQSLASFRDGKSKILIATSVAEEGLDIRACNLVIMYNYVTGEVGRIQRAGRGRAENSRSILITTKDSEHIDREKSNAICAFATEVAINDIKEISNEQLKVMINAVQKTQRKERQQRNAEVKRKIEEASKWKILCGNCRSFLTTADKLRQIKNQHKFVVDPDFHKQVQKTPWRGSPPELAPGAMAVGTFRCNYSSCMKQVGLEMQYKEKLYPTLTVRHLLFENVVNGDMKVAKQWNKCPFDIERSMDESDEEPEKLPVQETEKVVSKKRKLTVNAEDLSSEEAAEFFDIQD